MRRLLLIMVLAFGALPALATVTHVGGGKCEGVNTCTTGAVAVVATGDLVVSSCSIKNTSSTCGISVAGTLRAGPITGDNSWGRMWGWTSIAASPVSTTLTCTDLNTSGANLGCVFDVYHSNVGPSWVYDAACSASGLDGSGGGTRQCGTGGSSLSTAAGSVVLSAHHHCDRDCTTWTAGTDVAWTLAFTTATVIGEAEYFISATGSITTRAPLTSTTAAHWIVIAISVKEQAAGVSCTPTLTLLGVGRCG